MDESTERIMAMLMNSMSLLSHASKALSESEARMLGIEAISENTVSNADKNIETTEQQTKTAISYADYVVDTEATIAALGELEQMWVKAKEKRDAENGYRKTNAILSPEYDFKLSPEERLWRDIFQQD